MTGVARYGPAGWQSGCQVGHRRLHWSSLLPPPMLPEPVGAGRFSLHCRLPLIRFLEMVWALELVNDWTSPVTRFARICALPPCLSWMLPPTAVDL